jgi:hypothetical protein
MHSVIIVSYMALNSFSLKCLKRKAALKGGIPLLKVA